MTPPKEGSRFEALFGAAKARAVDPPTSEIDTKHSDIQTSKSKDPTLPTHDSLSTKSNSP